MDKGKLSSVSNQKQWGKGARRRRQGTLEPPSWPPSSVPLCTRARRGTCSAPFHLPAQATKALRGARAGVRAGERLGSPASSVLPGQEGIHAANVMISAQEGDEGWSVKLSDCCEQAWENRRIQAVPLGLCRAQISPPERRIEGIRGGSEWSAGEMSRKFLNCGHAGRAAPPGP